MKVFLMFKDRDFELKNGLPLNEHSLAQDLELNTLFHAMALGDQFLFEVAQKAVLTGFRNDLETIRYRQDILKDCLKNSLAIRDIYNIATATIQKKKKDYYGFFSRYPSSILYNAVEMLHMLVDALRKIRDVADEQGKQFDSEGFTNFFGMLKKELADEYLARIQSHLKMLKFSDGVLISAELGEGNKGGHYILRRTEEEKKSWLKRVLTKKPNQYTFRIAERDESGARALSELKGLGINLAANSLAQSADHILSFINMLRTELAFYITCLNLHERLVQIGGPLSFPLPVDSCEHKLSFRELYDVCLALTMNKKIVGCEANLDNKNLVVITGANQGGKSTFLRSIGLSQLMMQCGMFTPAESYCASLCDSLFTHYKREEDTTMKSGKLDEELNRMSQIADQLTSKPMLLFNESFAATNEIEGSEIARQIITALSEQRLRVFFVTHLYEFAHDSYNRKNENAIFLRAERLPDGGRNFKIIEGEPLQTSYGEDLYHKTFERER